jgi:two-component system, sensor histidine kinase and response regulator
MDNADAPPLADEGASATDPEALARLRRFGGDKLLHEMIGLYLANAPERLAAAKAGVANGDRASAELALHSLKSSSAQLGAARVGKLSERGEIIARGGSLDGVAEIITEMEAELARAAKWLESARDGDVA